MEIGIGIAGCLGKMGKELAKASHLNNKTKLIGGFDLASHPNIGKTFNDVLNIDNQIIIEADKEKVFKNSDVIIDFTTPECTHENLNYAKKFLKPIIIGTTGLSDETEILIDQISKNAPVIKSSNMSVGVNILFNMVEKLSKKLDSKDYNVKIHEIHHKHKIDAPSGTALSIGEIVAKTRNLNFDKKKKFENFSDQHSERIGDIEFSVERKGEIPGHHFVNFTSENDEIEIIHKASSRKIFVDGAIKAAIWLVNQKPGLYSMKEVLEL